MLSYVVYIVVYIILYCNDDWRIKDGVVHRSCQQSLVAKWLAKALCLQLGLGLGLGPWMELFLFFFVFLCVKVTKTFVLLSWHVTVQRSDVRPTLRDVMMMYSKEQYMENLPP